MANKWAEPIKSPLLAYPGTVTFPAHFTLPHYRAWAKANNELKEIESDPDRYGTSLTYSEDHPGDLVGFDPRQWAHVLAVVGSVDLENMPEEAFADVTGESTPLEVLAWLIPLVRDEYIPEKLNLKNS